MRNSDGSIVRKEFITNLIAYTDRRDNYEAQRQTMHLGMLEIILSAYNVLDELNDLEKALRSVDKTEYRKKIFYLLYNYMSIEDDENQRKIAAEYAWKSYAYLTEDENVKDIITVQNYNAACIYNSIAYSANNYILNENNEKETSWRKKEVIRIHESAKNIIDELIKTSPEDRKYRVLKGKILNNFGAAYTGAYYRDYVKALGAHVLAKSYREENNLDLTASFRCVATDYFYIAKKSEKIEKKSKYHKKALDMYFEYLGYVLHKKKHNEIQEPESIGFSEGNKLWKKEYSEELRESLKELVVNLSDDDWNDIEENVDSIIVVNAIGNELLWMRLLKTEEIYNKEIQDRDFFEKNIIRQLALCVKRIDRKSRVFNKDYYLKVKDKMNDLYGTDGKDGLIKLFGESRRLEMDKIKEDFDAIKS